jgi:hypothetical protein
VLVFVGNSFAVELAAGWDEHRRGDSALIKHFEGQACISAYLTRKKGHSNILRVRHAYLHI